MQKLTITVYTSRQRAKNIIMSVNQCLYDRRDKVVYVQEKATQKKEAQQ